MSEALSASYQGFSISKDQSNNKTIQGFVGFKEQCLEYMGTISIGTSGEFGYLESIDFAQKDGPFWEVKLGWDGNERGINISPTGSGPQYSSLSMRSLSLPIEKAANYKTNWNHILIGLSGQAESPSFWSTAKTVAISRNLYRQV